MSGWQRVPGVAASSSRCPFAQLPDIEGTPDHHPVLRLLCMYIKPRLYTSGEGSTYTIRGGGGGRLGLNKSCCLRTALGSPTFGIGRRRAFSLPRTRETRTRRERPAETKRIDAPRPIGRERPVKSNYRSITNTRTACRGRAVGEGNSAGPPWSTTRRKSEELRWCTNLRPHLLFPQPPSTTLSLVSTRERRWMWDGLTPRRLVDNAI